MDHRPEQATMADSWYKTPPSRRLSVSSLLSPPEAQRVDSFNHLSYNPVLRHSEPFNPSLYVPFQFDTQSMKNPKLGGLANGRAISQPYASPPISPFDTNAQKENLSGTDTQGARDPQLFTSSVPPAVANVPLFPSEAAAPTPQDEVAKYMGSKEYAQLRTQPSREDYNTFLQFHATVFKQAFRNPRRWWDQERSFDKYYGRPSGVTKPAAPSNLAPAPSSRRRQQKMALPRLTTEPPRPARVKRTPKRTPKTQTHNSFNDTKLSETPKRAPITRDVDYNALPDFAPPYSTITKENEGPFFRAEWKGKPLTVTDDPELGNLAPAELRLACTLRLGYASYMCTKRRIFQSYVDYLKRGKVFCKTNAQDACKVDVNKASKLWEVYNAVGWFKNEHFVQYI